MNNKKKWIKTKAITHRGVHEIFVSLRQFSGPVGSLVAVQA